MAKRNRIYTDGGLEKFAIVVVEDDRRTYEVVSTYGMSVTTTNDDTEGSAILAACEYVKGHPGNWIIITDSKAIIDKIRGGTNATRNPSINGIKNILKEVNTSPDPISIEIKWQKRLSDEHMKYVDGLCR